MFPIRDHHPSHKFPFITYLLIAANVLIFLYQLMVPDLDSFILSFALVPENVNFFDLTTLIPFFTSMFLHGGWLHIISNMWFLYIFGDNVEASMGSFGYLGFYVVCGFAAGLLQYMFDTTSVIPMLGASGAIAGVLGSYLVFFPKAQIETVIAGFGIWTINVPAQVMLIYWFVTQFFSGVGSIGIDGGGVAFWAHIGGFAAGFVITKFLIKPQLVWQRIE